MTKHLLTIDSLTRNELEQLLEQALAMRPQPTPTPWSPLTCQVFFEHSTRTQCSFSLALDYLGITTLPFDCQQSSKSKGEDDINTLKTLEDLGVRLFIIRHGSDFFPQRWSEACYTDTRIINAGDGSHAHPSQALIDIMTIHQYYRTFNLKVAVIGDVDHSRVAASTICALQTLGVQECRIVGPSCWTTRYQHLPCYDNLEEGVAGVDVVITLRIQKERFTLGEDETADYHSTFGLSVERLKKYCPQAILLHPGPVNLGVECSPDIIECQQSMIRRQVTNGILARMAMIHWIASRF